MARKPLFKSLVESADGEGAVEQAAPSPFPSSRPMQKMRTSLIDLQKSALQDIRLDLIDDFQFHDRVDIKEDLDSLAASLEERGQEVPVKVRPIEGGSRYQVIVGRRRCAAARRLDWTTIKAIVQEADDIDSLKAMITENSERREASYIGQARLCAKIVQNGIKQSKLAAIMGRSQAHISRMMNTYAMVGEEIILSIGDATGHARKSWDGLGESKQRLGLTDQQVVDMVDTSIPVSSDRLKALLLAIEEMERLAVEEPRAKRQLARSTTTSLWDGRCQVRASPKRLSVKLGDDGPEDLIKFINERIPSLVEEFVENNKDKNEV